MRQFLLTFLTLAMLLTTIAGCSRGYQFVGIVVDGQGIGIDGAQILLYEHSGKRPESSQGQETNGDGTFEASWCCTPGVEFFRMVVSKPGYDDDNRIVAADEKDIRVVLSQSSLVD